VVEGVLGLDPLFGAAVLVMAVLPPPFVIPLYMREGVNAGDADHQERGYVTDTLSLGTLATLVAIPVIALAFSG
jgi:hypothetical protein